MPIIRIGEDRVEYTAGLEAAMRLLALSCLHAGQRITWPDGTVNWYEQRTDGLWLHTRQPGGLTSATQVHF